MSEGDGLTSRCTEIPRGFEACEWEEAPSDRHGHHMAVSPEFGLVAYTPENGRTTNAVPIRPLSNGDIGRGTEKVDSLFGAIAHGPPAHRAWLKQAIEDHFAGRPVQKEASNVGQPEAMKRENCRQAALSNGDIVREPKEK